MYLDGENVSNCCISQRMKLAVNISMIVEKKTANYSNCPKKTEAHGPPYSASDWLTLILVS